MKLQLTACAFALACALVWGGFTAHAGLRRDDEGEGHRVGKVFVVGMENHNWTQPAGQQGARQIFLNEAAPFINSLVNGKSGISDQVSYATKYLNAGPGVHPSEPNYIWAEAGNPGNSLNNDDDPYHQNCTEDTVLDTDQHLTAFLHKAHKTWNSYQEDANVNLMTNIPLPMASWAAPLFSHNGLFTGMNAFNEYNYTKQYNYAAKHNPQIFFKDTNGTTVADGGCQNPPSTANRYPNKQYPPLQQLALDLQSNHVANYNWITPNQYNDQHSALTGGYGAFTGDQASIAQGDNFLARVVPLIMASKAYQENGVIVLWWDESEGGDDAQHTLPFFIISKLAHANVGGLPYASNIDFSHSSFLRTMQEIFEVDPDSGHNFPWLGAAVANASDLAALFKPGVIR
jgi:hypothetical protein